MAGESKDRQNLKLIEDIKAGRANPCALPSQLLRRITDDFSQNRELGRGGFGVVYKGVLGNGEIVAVKKLKHSIDFDSGEISKEARHLMRLKHQNIVRFLGYCFETRPASVDHEGKKVYIQENLLCLEYIPHGLRKYVQDGSSGIDWNMRYKIIKGICYGLHYLHEKNVIHLDLKPDNILLSNEKVPKITDFGLSRLFNEQQSRTYTGSSARGTPGYIPPEYIDQGLITKKSDIFSLGVTIIEVITGRKDYPESIGASKHDFVKNVLDEWGQRLRQSGTSSLENDCEQIERCIKLGLDCRQTDWRKRPTSEEIIRNLSTWENASPPPANRPPPSNQSSGSRSRCSACNNPISAGTKFFTQDGKRYHEVCYKEHFNLKCVVCNNFLPSDSNGKMEWRVRPSGEKYCPHHDNNNAGTPSGCSGCNKPISAGTKFFTRDGKRYHELCYKKHLNLKCVICNNFIPSDSNGGIKWGIRPSGEKYCLSHENAGTSSQGCPSRRS